SRHRRPGDGCDQVAHLGLDGGGQAWVADRSLLAPGADGRQASRRVKFRPIAAAGHPGWLLPAAFRSAKTCPETCPNRPALYPNPPHSSGRAKRKPPGKLGTYRGVLIPCDVYESTALPTELRRPRVGTVP